VILQAKIAELGISIDELGIELWWAGGKVNASLIVMYVADA